MNTILLSINPEYIENIFNGIKQYEYRKIKCRKDIEKIIIYSTYPVRKVVGEARVEKILGDTPNNIWKITEKYSGTSIHFYNEYFKGREKAIAYKLIDVKKYNKPKQLSEYGIKCAPQSFIYIK
ncbi:MAG: hypothetical protein K0R72_1016 [Clostridia bacterium]|nr:hypothetical protein [Clostridia bacterium]